VWHNATADVVLRREAFYASLVQGPHYAYWPVNFRSTWHGRRSALFQNGGLVAGNKASAHCQHAQRQNKYVEGNVVLLAVEPCSPWLWHVSEILDRVPECHKNGISLPAAVQQT
jgi:hypothetical protein